MISKTTYLEDRRLDIKTEGSAIFGQTIVNRLLNAKIIINGKKETKSFKTLGKVIDLVVNDQLKDIVSLSRKHRREIVEYLDQIGVLEYLGIKTENNNINL